MRVRLLWKLLAVPLLVLLCVLVAIWIAFDLQAADYFMTLMKQYDVDAPEVNRMFLEASHRTLIQTAVAGLVVAAALCFVLTRRLLRPLEEMQRAAARIAAGDYEDRVPVRSRDELGELAGAFNRMAGGLADTERARRRMVVDVAHELRTPLTNLRGYVEALQDGVLDSDAKVLGILHDELLRLVRLTEALLSTARGEHRGPSLRPVCVVDLLGESLELFRLRLARRRLELRQRLPATDGRLHLDPDLMKQVFDNLLENCLQFAPEGSWVEVAAAARPRWLRLSFRNPGENLDPQDLERIFTPYYRGEKSRSRERGGAGIGLAIVEAHVRAHGGRVGARSADGVTEVWIELPHDDGAALPNR